MQNDKEMMMIHIQGRQHRQDRQLRQVQSDSDVEQFVVTLRALPNDSRPAIQRLRMLLKHALRCQRLRCVRLSGNEPEAVQVGGDDLGDK
jgi:hypothetical protein